MSRAAPRRAAIGRRPMAFVRRRTIRKDGVRVRTQALSPKQAAVPSRDRLRYAADEGQT
jgi:hypothetical protein